MNPSTSSTTRRGRGRAQRRTTLQAIPGSPIPHEAATTSRDSPTSRSTSAPVREPDPRGVRGRPADLVPDPDLGRQLNPPTAGSFSFPIGGEPRRLTAYVLDGGQSDSLFVPFLDATSGHETYGAGRYLDLEPEDDGTYALDFNLAYHPNLRLFAECTRAR